VLTGAEGDNEQTFIKQRYREVDTPGIVKRGVSVIQKNKSTQSNCNSEPDFKETFQKLEQTLVNTLRESYKEINDVQKQSYLKEIEHLNDAVKTKQEEIQKILREQKNINEIQTQSLLKDIQLHVERKEMATKKKLS
jgi:hypothetical protein